MKEIVGKRKFNSDVLPKHIILDKIEINYAKSIAVECNGNLARKISQSDCGLNCIFERNMINKR